jgi:anti-sigma factor RsiW
MSEHVVGSLGGYVLGALEPAERAAVEAHLHGCPSCREELSPLAGLPGLLSRLSEADFAEPEPEPEVDPDPAVLHRVLDRLAADRRQRQVRTRLVAAAAAVLLVAGGTGAGALLTQGHAPGPARVVSAVDAGTGAQARFALSSHSWGTGVQVRLQHVAAGTHCRLVAVDRQGREQTIGTWLADYDGSAAVNTATDLPLSEVAALKVLTAQGRPVVAASLPLQARVSPG